MFRILLVDDHPLARAGMVAILGAASDFDVVGEAATALEAMDLFKTLRPDIALVDVRIGRDNGIELVRAFCQEAPGTLAVMLTSSDNGNDIRDALGAGASGYLLKNAPALEIHAALRVVGAGGDYIQEELKPFLAEALQEQALSPMENEILTCLARGLSNREIAMFICRSHDTVKFYLKALFRKIGAANRAEAASIAVHRGLLGR